MAIKTTKSGKEIRTGKDYKGLRVEVLASQRDATGIARCADCDRPIEYETFHNHHLEGRAGGKRDDVIARQGVRKCLGLCPPCHMRRHGHL